MSTPHPDDAVTAYSDLEIRLGDMQVRYGSGLPDNLAHQLADIPLIFSSILPGGVFALLLVAGCPLWACFVMALGPYLVALLCVRRRRAGFGGGAPSRLAELRHQPGGLGAQLAPPVESGPSGRGALSS